jgi:hypothetical protein
LSPKTELTVALWLGVWLTSIPEAELGYGYRHRLTQLVKTGLGEFGKRAVQSVGAAEAYRFTQTLPKQDRRLAYAFINSGLRAAKNAGFSKNYPGFPAKRVIGKFVWLSARGVLVAALVAAVVTAGFALDRVMRLKEDTLTAVATVVRQAGFGVVVAAAEDFYYTYLNTPKVGGWATDSSDFGARKPSGEPTARASASKVAFVEEWGVAKAPSLEPARLIPPVAAEVNEGFWKDTKIVVNRSTAIRIARIRPDTEHTSYYATIAWLDSKLLAFAQVPGTDVPEGNFDHGNGLVPDNLRPFYVAGLNNAFLMRDSQGGYVYEGTVIRKLVYGKATLVTYSDGSLDVLKWGRDKPTKAIQAARQNLTLMVDGSASQVQDESQAKWGWVWEGVGSGKNLVWRSAIGVRADGTIVYCIGPVLSAKSLADMMVRAGAVRAMPLDMNSAYANGFLYGPYAPGKRIDPGIFREADRFWAPSERDFVAVYAKSP